MHEDGHINLASIENTLKSRLISPTRLEPDKHMTNCIVHGQEEEEEAQNEPRVGACCNAINFMARLLNG